MKKRTFWIIGISSFIFFLIATAPASLIKNMNSKDLTLGGFKGSIWTGSADTVNFRGVNIGRLKWQVSPFSLFLFRLNAKLKTENLASHITMNLQLAPGRISSDSIKAQVPAQWLDKLFKLPLKTEGILLIRLVQLQFETDAPIKIQGSVAWQKAAITTPFGQRSALGNLQIAIDSDARDILLDIKDGGSPLGIKSTIRFSPPNTIKAAGSVNSELPQSLANFFKFFAKPGKDGRLEFHYQGKVPGL